MSSYAFLVISLLLINTLQFIMIMKLVKKSSEFEDAVKRIDRIISAMKPPKPQIQELDPRRRLEWKIKR